MRTQIEKHVENPQQFKVQLLQYFGACRELVYLDSNDYPQTYGSYDAVLAADAFTSIQTDHHKAFDDLQTYQQQTQDWIFGYLSYDLKNATEALVSQNPDGLQFPELFFFQPKKLFLIKGNRVEMAYLHCCDDELEPDFEAIIQTSIVSNHNPTALHIQARVDRQTYLDRVGHMLAHIHRGDIYEANFCMEFYAEDAAIHPVDTFISLNAISTPPFATYLKNHKNHLICASPERFLRKDGSRILSQPIKGTARRSPDPVEDTAIKDALLANEKERSENIMIVDLVRNDLSRTAAKASVKVTELCGAYSFRQVHHLISTIESQQDVQFSGIEVIRDAFPMGSMTGAPKISAMKIIEQLEQSKRGLYSGAVGYFTPNGDFDFNVVIRSILYNEALRYVSFSVGSAITAEASAESEYEECLLKAKAMRQVLEQSR